MDPMMVRALNQRQNQAPMRFFEDGTQGMWTDAASMLLPAWASGVAVGVGATGLWNDRRIRKAEENKRPLDASREEPRYRPRSQG